MISGPQFFKVEEGKILETEKKEASSLTKVVQCAVRQLQSQSHELTYFDVDRVYRAYSKRLKKSLFSKIKIWWNKGTLEILETNRKELYKDLFTNPTRRDFEKLINLSPQVIISKDSKNQLLAFLDSLSLEEKQDYLKQFIQGNLETIISEIARRSDFLKKFPDIIQKSSNYVNFEAVPKTNIFAYQVAQRLQTESDVITLKNFWKDHSLQISKLMQNPEKDELSYRLVRLLESKISLLSKQINIKTSGLPFHMLRGGGNFSIGEYSYRYSEQGFDQIDQASQRKIPFTANARIKLAEQLIDRGEYEYLPSVFSTSLLTLNSQLNDESEAILHKLVCHDDLSIAIKSAHVLVKNGIKLDENEINKINAHLDLIHEDIGTIKQSILGLNRYEVASLAIIPQFAAKVRTLQLENYRYQEPSRATKVIAAPQRYPKEKENRNEGKKEYHPDLQSFKEAFSAADPSKAEYKEQAQDAFDSFLKIAQSIKEEELQHTQINPLPEAYQKIVGHIGDASLIEQDIKLLKVDLQIEINRKEILLYSKLPPFSPPVLQLILAYGQGSLDLVLDVDKDTLDVIQKSIAEVIQARQELQKCERIEGYIKAGTDNADQEKFNNRLDLMLRECPAYDDPLKFPFLQVAEYFLNIYARPQQVESITKLGETDKKKVLQLLMGSGKTFLLLPILALLRADGNNLSTVMVPEPLFSEVSKQLQNTLGSSFDKIVASFTVPHGDVTVEYLKELLITLQDVRSNRGILVITPERQHALLNSLTSILKSSKDNPSPLEDEKLILILKVIKLLSTSENVIADEVDQLLRTNLQYIITLGEPKSFGIDQREIISSLVLFVSNNPNKFPVAFDFATNDSAKPRVTIESYHEHVKSVLADQAIDLLKDKKDFRALIDGNEALLKIFFTLPTKNEENQQISEAEAFFNSLDENRKRVLLDIRMALVDVLPKTFFSNVNEKYGLTNDQETFLARPFEGPGCPAKTQFSNPIEQVAKTVQALIKMGIPDSAFEKAKKTFPDLENFTIKGIQNNPQLFESFIKQCVLPEVKIHPEQITSDGHKLVSSSESYSGISGTFWNVTTFPQFNEIIPDEKEEVSALLKLNNKVSRDEITFNKVDHLSKKDSLLELLVPKSGNPPLALIDSAGWLKDVSEEDFIQTLLEQRADLEGIVIHNKKGHLCVIDRNKACLPLSESTIPVDKRLTIYKQQYTTGTDIPQAASAKAVLTIGKEMILRDFQQSIFRMRGILQNQQAVLAYDAEAQAQMAMLTSMKEVNFPSFLKFLMTSQSVRRLQDNYQAVHQRMHDRLEALVRNRMLELVDRKELDGEESNLDKIHSLFKVAEHLFIEKKKDSISSGWSFPTKVKKEERVLQDVNNYTAQFETVRENLELTFEEVQDALKECYDLELLDETLETGQPSDCGLEVLQTSAQAMFPLQAQQVFQVSAQEMKQSLQDIAQRLDEAQKLIDHKTLSKSLSAKQKALEEKLSSFKTEVSSQNLLIIESNFDRLMKDGMSLKQSFSHLKEIAQIENTLIDVEKELSILNEIVSTFGKNRIISNFEVSCKNLHQAIDEGDFDAVKQRAEAFALAHSLLDPELKALQEEATKEIAILNAATKARSSELPSQIYIDTIDIRDVHQLESLRKARSEDQKAHAEFLKIRKEFLVGKREELNKLQKELSSDLYGISGQILETINSELQKQEKLFNPADFSSDLLPSSQIANDIRRLKDEHKARVDVQSACKAILGKYQSKDSLRDAVINLMKSVKKSGFKEYNECLEDLQKAIQNIQTIENAESLLSLQSIKDLGLEDTVIKRITFLKSKSFLLQQSKSMLPNKLSKGLQDRIGTLIHKINRSNTAKEIKLLEFEYQDIQEAAKWFSETSKKREKISKEVHRLEKLPYGNAQVSKHFIAFVEKLNERSTQTFLDRKTRNEIDESIARLESLTPQVFTAAQLQHSASDLLSACPERKEVSILQQIQTMIDRENQARKKLLDLNNQLNMGSETLSEWAGLIGRSLGDLSQNIELFKSVHADVDELITRQVHKAREFLTSSLEALPEKHRLHEKIKTALLEKPHVAFLNEAAHIRKEFDTYLKNESFNQKALLEALNDRINSFKGSLSKVDSLALENKIQKLSAITEVRPTRQSKLEIINLQEEVTRLESLVGVRQSFFNRVNLLRSDLKTHVHPMTAFSYENELDSIVQVLTQPISLQEWNKQSEAIEAAFAKIDTAISFSKIKAKAFNYAKMIIDGVDDESTLSSFISLLKDPLAQSLSRQKEFQERVAEACIALSQKGKLSLSKAILDAANIKSKKIIRSLQEASVDYVCKNLINDTHKLLDVYFEDEELHLDYDKLMEGFALRYLQQNEILIQLFEEAGFDEQIISEAVMQFKIASGAISSSLEVQALMPIAQYLNSDPKIIEEMSFDTVFDMQQFVAFGIDNLKAYEGSLNDNERVEVEKVRYALETAHKNMEKRVARLRSLQTKASIMNGLFATARLGMGAMAITTSIATYGMAPAVALYMTNMAVSKAASVFIIDPLVDISTQKLPDSIKPAAAFLIKAGLGFAVTGALARYSDLIVSGVKNITGGNQLEDTVQQAANNIGNEPCYNKKAKSFEELFTKKEQPMSQPMEFRKPLVEEVQQRFNRLAAPKITPIEEAFKQRYQSFEQAHDYHFGISKIEKPMLQPMTPNLHPFGEALEKEKVRLLTEGPRIQNFGADSGHGAGNGPTLDVGGPKSEPLLPNFGSGGNGPAASADLTNTVQQPVEEAVKTITKEQVDEIAQSAKIAVQRKVVQQQKVEQVAEQAEGVLSWIYKAFKPRYTGRFASAVEHDTVLPGNF